MIKQIKGPLINYGNFTHCYKHKQDPLKVLLRSRDPVKEAQSLDWFPNTPNFIPVKFIEHCPYSGEFKWYETTRVERFSMKRLNPDDLAKYKSLKLITNNEPRAEYIYDDLARAGLQDICEAIHNLYSYGQDLYLEPARRNLGIFNGRLIYLDIFFFASKVRRYHLW